MTSWCVAPAGRVASQIGHRRRSHATPEVLLQRTHSDTATGDDRGHSQRQMRNIIDDLHCRANCARTDNLRLEELARRTMTGMSIQLWVVADRRQPAPSVKRAYSFSVCCHGIGISKTVK